MTGMNVRQMENTIQQLEAQLNTYRERVRQQDEYLDGAAKATQEIVSACRKFCYKILEPLVASGECSMHELQGSTLPDLIKRAQDAYNVEQNRTQAIYTQFAEKLKEKAETISGLQAQNSQLQIQLAQAIQGGEQALPDAAHEEPDLQRQTAYLIDNGKDEVDSVRPALQRTTEIEDEPEIADFAKSVVEETATATAAVAVTQGKPKKPERKPMMVDFETYKSQMTPLMWLILQVMGGEGVCEFPEIRDRCMQLSGQDNKISISNLNAALGALRNIGAISRNIKINTGIRWFYLYELEEIGYRIYTDRFKKPPVDSEMKRLISEHDNLKHGYYIKDAANILKEKYSYTSVSISRKANFIRLQKGKASIPDIVCADGTKTDYFEVECGNHQQADFNDKCNKLAMVTPNLRFIVPDADTMNKKLVPQIETWIRSTNGSLAKSSILVYITTMKKLNENEWMLVYDLSSAQPDKPTTLSEESA